MLAPIAPSNRHRSELQSCRADELVGLVNTAMAREPLRQQWDVPLNINPEIGSDCGAARWAQQRFNKDDSGYRAELSEKGSWTLRVTSWTKF